MIFFFFFLGKECRDNISASLNCTENVFQRICVLNSGSHALFTRSTSTKLAKFLLKLGLTVLFTYLKIILLQYF